MGRYVGSRSVHHCQRVVCRIPRRPALGHPDFRDPCREVISDAFTSLKLLVDRNQRVKKRTVWPQLSRWSLHWLEPIGIVRDDNDSILQFRPRGLLDPI